MGSGDRGMNESLCLSVRLFHHGYARHVLSRHEKDTPRVSSA